MAKLPSGQYAEKDVNLPMPVSASINPSPPSYLHLLRQLHRHLRPRTYVEIGVGRGRSLALALPETLAVGIDPTPAVSASLPPRTLIFRCASDDFFASHALSEVLGSVPLDLAFIDGHHTFDQALRDFINLERTAVATTTVLIHDTYPRDRRTATRHRRTRFWSGDVWRLVVALKQYRPDLYVATLDVPPTGLTIVRGLNPHSDVLQQEQESLVLRLLGLDYSYLEECRGAKLNQVRSDWATVRGLLGRG